LFLIGKTDCIHIATYALVCCGLTVLTLFITLVYKYKTDRHDITEILLKVFRLKRRVPLMEQERLTLPEHMSSPPVLVGFVLPDIFSLMCMFCRSLFVLLYFFFWPLCCLFFSDIRILIAPFVSSNSSSINYI
jgi:hypothetical protein